MSINSSDANRQEDYDPWATLFDPDDAEYNPDTGKLIELPADPTEDYDAGDLDEQVWFFTIHKQKVLLFAISQPIEQGWPYINRLTGDRCRRC